MGEKEVKMDVSTERFVDRRIKLSKFMSKSPISFVK